MEKLKNAQVSSSYRLTVENTSDRRMDVILCDVKKSKLPNFGNPYEINVGYGLSFFSYGQFLADIEARPVVFDQIGIFGNKEPLSLIGEWLTDDGFIFSMPLSKGYIYPNEKVYLDVNFSLGEKEANSLGEPKPLSHLVIHQMPPMSRLWIELFPASKIPSVSPPVTQEKLQ